MPALTPKRIGLLLLVVIGIIGAASLLSGCGNDEPADHHEVNPPAPATAAAPAAPAEPATPAEPAAPAETAAAPAAPAEEPAAEEDTEQRWEVKCYAGEKVVLSYGAIRDSDWEFVDGNVSKFMHQVSGSDKEILFSGPCLGTQL